MSVLDYRNARISFTCRDILYVKYR